MSYFNWWPILVSSEALAERSASLAVTLDDARLAARSQASIALQGVVTLDAATLNATSSALVGVRLSVTLDDALTTAAGTVSVSASLATLLDDARVAARLAAQNAARLSVTLDDQTLAASATAIAGLSLAVTLDDAVGAASAGAASMARVSVTTEGARLIACWRADSDPPSADATAPTADGLWYGQAARIEVLVQAALAVTLDSATIAARIATLGERALALDVTTQDAVIAARATVADTPVVVPMRTSAGGRRRRRGPRLDAPLIAYEPERREVAPQPERRIAARRTTDAARLAARASPTISARGAVALQRATLTAQSAVDAQVRSVVATQGAALRSATRVDWSAAIADDDELLTLLVA